jgi:glycerate kinase
VSHVVIAPDKFAGTLPARGVAHAAALGAERAGWSASLVPMSDGGEGLLEVFSEARRHEAVVTGPLGGEIRAPFATLDIDGTTTALIEMAQASGIGLVGGRAGNDATRATTRGTGQLIAAARAAGARRIVVGCGGSASTDGGLGALEALRAEDLRDVELIAAVDVSTRFVDAARVFGPQKGADPPTVAALETRLAELAIRYIADFGVDVREVPGSGAAGGLAGGLLALGARIVSGFDLVASFTDLPAKIAMADAVVTGEGRLDPTSLEGKVVGGVISIAEDRPVLVVCGEAVDYPELGPHVSVVAIAERVGLEASLADPAPQISVVVEEWLSALS